MKRILVSAALLVGLVAVLPQAMTAPEPFEVPTTWELEFEFRAPQPITVTLPGRKKPSTFWYMLYSVTNLTRNLETGRGADQDFIPEFIMYTDTGQATLSDRRLSAGVFTVQARCRLLPVLRNSSPPSLLSTNKFPPSQAKTLPLATPLPVPGRRSDHCRWKSCFQP